MTWSPCAGTGIVRHVSLSPIDIAHQEEVMRKIIGAIAIATLVGSGLTGLPAAGAAPGGRVGTADFTGTSTFDFGSPDCAPGPHQVFDATITGKKGATLHIEGCVDLSNASNIRFTGSFTIAWPRRHSVTGTATSTPVTTTPSPCASGLTAALSMELTPVRVHGQPRPPIALAGTWCSPGIPGVPGPISGTLSGALPPILH
jgi:hypothetical protein